DPVTLAPARKRSGERQGTGTLECLDRTAMGLSAQDPGYRRGSCRTAACVAGAQDRQVSHRHCPKRTKSCPKSCSRSLEAERWEQRRPNMPYPGSSGTAARIYRTLVQHGAETRSSKRGWKAMRQGSPGGAATSLVVASHPTCALLRLHGGTAARCRCK